ncbi:hypothetical protein [Pseudomonas putida]|uniref:hypothetical protein n=1 Tax=Pseudomonas putida TaxID=303 RepID=UPI0011982AB9|nr:hypothetical protein [Pseudomonas putida]
MLLFKTLIGRYHALIKSLAREPSPTDPESAREMVEALRQLAAEADRLEAQLRQMTEKRPPRQRPSGPPVLRLVQVEKIVALPDQKTDMNRNQ